ncbi:MAG: SNF2-related protein, partial [bacterium]
MGPDRERLAPELATADVVLTSYALLRRDEDFFQRYDFAYAILDEAQNIKNPLSATARTAKKLRSKRRLALTGTPIENRIEELWSLFEFLNPGMLGAATSFANATRALGVERATLPPTPGKPADDVLSRALRPVILRRTKA